MSKMEKWINILLTQSKYALNMLRSRLYITRNGYVDSVIYKNKKIKLYLSEHNCGLSYRKRLTERALELALAKDWITNSHDEYIEIGAVTPYYMPDFSKHSVIDPADAHEMVDIKKSLFECDYRGKNVLSISTIEHVGTGDYQLTKTEDCVEGLNKVIQECKSCLVSFPMGYNRKLDNYVMDEMKSGQFSKNQKEIKICAYGRSKYGNDWKILTNLEEQYADYEYGPLWANCVCFIEKI